MEAATPLDCDPTPHSSAMATASFQPEPDLTPLYPTPATVSPLLSPNFGLESAQKAQLVAHCLARACVFGELSLLTYLLRDPQSQPHVDLCIRDEEDIGLISTTILGFGSDSDRDIEREECVRLLLYEGADVETPDKGVFSISFYAFLVDVLLIHSCGDIARSAGWTPLHYAAVLSPPTLISHFLKSGCSPFIRTRRNLTPLDLVTGHSPIPGRETVAFLLEEAMRTEGWTGGRMEERRKALEERTTRLKKRDAVREGINQALGFSSAWWGENGSDVDEDDDDEDEIDEAVYVSYLLVRNRPSADSWLQTPPKDLGSMLAFSPPWLPEIFQSLITNFPITACNSEPANALYLLARFACLYCDQTWLEELVIEATDTIEDTFFVRRFSPMPSVWFLILPKNRPDDLPCLVFWVRPPKFPFDIFQLTVGALHRCIMQPFGYTS